MLNDLKNILTNTSRYRKAIGKELVKPGFGFCQKGMAEVEICKAFKQG